MHAKRKWILAELFSQICTETKPPGVTIDKIIFVFVLRAEWAQDVNGVSVQNL
jgi:hypothetical protein